MVAVKFEVKTTAIGYWLAVDEIDVPMDANGVGTINLTPGSHAVVWWFQGNPSDSITFTAKDGARVVVEVKKSAIPEGETFGGGLKRFTV